MWTVSVKATQRELNETRLHECTDARIHHHVTFLHVYINGSRQNDGNGLASVIDVDTDVNYFISYNSRR